ncbi:hypothetical protein ACQUW5_14535 [Legionella sp. CNM-1927-20]|uniref:hypothetical protein n=1 Tax=Legionella sp. CNM-1927-20 TaxID=3422221 RepID=UPI00403AD3C6
MYHIWYINQIYVPFKELRKDTETFKENNRPLRNHLEHFDERLISKASHSNASSLRFVHSSKRSEYAIGSSETNYLRTIIYDKGIYSIAGHDYCLNFMLNELNSLCRYIIAEEPFFLEYYKDLFN